MMAFVLPHTRQPQAILKEIMYTFLCLSKGSFLPLHHRVCRICLAPVLSRRPVPGPTPTRSAPPTASAARAVTHPTGASRTRTATPLKLSVCGYVLRQSQSPTPSQASKGVSHSSLLFMLSSELRCEVTAIMILFGRKAFRGACCERLSQPHSHPARTPHEHVLRCPRKPDPCPFVRVTCSPGGSNHRHFLGISRSGRTGTRAERTTID